MHACINIYMKVYIRMCVHTCVHTYVRTYIRTYVCTHCTYVHRYVRTYVQNVGTVVFCTWHLCTFSNFSKMRSQVVTLSLKALVMGGYRLPSLLISMAYFCSHCSYMSLGASMEMQQKWMFIGIQSRDMRTQPTNDGAAVSLWYNEGWDNIPRL